MRRSGPHSYMGLCPFHDERTPSFSVEGVNKLFHCFGCGESGDVFDFVMKTENVDFTGALEVLADRAGVKLERVAEDPREAERRGGGGGGAGVLGGAGGGFGGGAGGG